jgi:hypothetical protein
MCVCEMWAATLELMKIGPIVRCEASLRRVEWWVVTDFLGGQLRPGPQKGGKWLFAMAWHCRRPLFREQNAEEGSEHRGRWSSRLEDRPPLNIHNSYSSPNFDVSLTVHLSITLANDQLDAHIFNAFITILYMYMFRAVSCLSSGGQIVLIQHMVLSLSVSDRLVHRLRKNSSSNVSRSVKLRGTRWTEHVTRMEKMATAYNNVVTKLKRTFCRRLGGSQGQSGRVSRKGKLCSRTGIKPKTVQAVVIHYTVCAV